MAIEFVQVNSRNLAETVSLLKHRRCIGFEVINPTIVEMLEVNIDPQHTGVKRLSGQYEPENISSALFVLQQLGYDDPCAQSTYVFEKQDIDSIAAASIWLNTDWILDDCYNHGGNNFGAIRDRVKLIDEMDCGVGNIAGNEWDPNYFSQKIIQEVTDFNVLGCMCSDKLPIVEKINYMFDWLLYGNLPEQYREQVTNEISEQKYLFTEILSGIICVTSGSRGVSNLIYSQSPFGVAYNPKFINSNGEVIKKFTIMQFTAEKSINLSNFLEDMKNIEEGWGGNIAAGIVGSPLKGTYLTKSEVCEILSRYVV